MKIVSVVLSSKTYGHVSVLCARTGIFVHFFFTFEIRLQVKLQQVCSLDDMQFRANVI